MTENNNDNEPLIPKKMIKLYMLHIPIIVEFIYLLRFTISCNGQKGADTTGFIIFFITIIPTIILFLFLIALKYNIAWQSARIIGFGMYPAIALISLLVSIFGIFYRVLFYAAFGVYGLVFSIKMFIRLIKNKENVFLSK